LVARRRAFEESTRERIPRRETITHKIHTVAYAHTHTHTYISTHRFRYIEIHTCMCARSNPRTQRMNIHRPFKKKTITSIHKLENIHTYTSTQKECKPREKQQPKQTKQTKQKKKEEEKKKKKKKKEEERRG
jgi:hypothetical protein